VSKLKAILKDFILHLSIWVKEPVYKPEVVSIKEWRKRRVTATKYDKDGFVIVDSVKIEDADNVKYHTPIHGMWGTVPMWTASMLTSGCLISATNYSDYFKDYLNETSTDSK
jgi:hypothetical protein